MFEKWFLGKNKKEIKPSVEGVAHFDEGILEEEKFDQKLDYIQENFKDNKVSTKNFHVRNRRKEDEGENWSAGVEKYLTKHEGSRKPKYKDLHSDWKEQEPFALDLSEEVEDKQTLNEKHLNAMAERYDDEDDYEGGNFEKAA